MIGRRSLSICTLIFTVLLIPEFCMTAGDNPKTRSTLTGLESVYVQTERLDPDLGKELKQGNLTNQGLRASVERELEKGGIKVLGEKDLQRAQHHSVLCVTVDILPPEAARKFIYNLQGEQIYKAGPDEKLFYTIEVELRQFVSLLRNPTIQERATTWSRNTMGFRRISRIEADVRYQVQGFVEAYSAANAN